MNSAVDWQFNPGLGMNGPICGISWGFPHFLLQPHSQRQYKTLKNNNFFWFRRVNLKGQFSHLRLSQQDNEFSKR